MKIIRQWKKVLSIFLILIMCIVSGNVLPISAGTTVEKPVILTNTITNATTSLQVYGTKDATLYIKNGTKTVAKKKYKKESVQTITIKAQKAGSTLKFYLQDGNRKSTTVKKAVKKLSSESESKKVKKPAISAAVKSTDTKIKVKGYKDTKLYIKNDSNKVVKTVKYKKNEIKSIKMLKPKDTQTLYFYLVKGKNRSAIVRKTVKDVTAPDKPALTEKKFGSLLVKGEVGSTVYVKNSVSSVYVEKGILTGKSGKVVSGLRPDSRGYYYVKLKDASGNSSAETKLKSKRFGDGLEEEDTEEGETETEEIDPISEYSYIITPLLTPFNEFFYVQTENPDPSDIRLIDKESIYYTQGSEPAYLEPVKKCFMDVVYEDKATARVKGGYVFASQNYGFDGGTLTVQKKVGKNYKDTKSQVSCPQVKGYVEYLIDTYTSSDKGFFEKLDDVQRALDTLALYPRGTKDVAKPSADFPYPMLTVSPYPENDLNDWYEMYETAEEPLLLNNLYPYVLDSYYFPLLMGNMARRFEPSCQVRFTDPHYLIEVTKDGETHVYGGAGEGDSTPLYSNRVEKLFLFDNSEQDFAKNTTLERLSEKRGEYGKYAREDAVYYRDLIYGKTFCQAVGTGSWIRVSTEGNLLKKFYTYVNRGYFFTEDSNYVPCCVKDVWVDGRYVSERKRWVPGVIFSDFPKADILLQNMAYTTKWGVERCGDVIYKYDEASGNWLSQAFASSSSSYWNPNLTLDEYPEDMILTPEQVEAMQVDRNTEIVPPGLIYDGTAFPGTPYE